MEFYVTDANAITYGQCLKFNAGKLIKAATTDVVAGVANHDVAAGTNQKCKILLVDPEQLWEADYTGEPISTFIVGCADAVLDGDGRNLNAAATGGGGPCSIIKINAAAKKAWVKFKKRQLT